MISPKVEKIKTRNSNKFGYVKCVGCDKYRWVLLIRGIPKSLRCVSCSKCGKLSKNWKGGKYLQDGYVYMTISIKDPLINMCKKHKNQRSYYVLEHRYVVANHIGRELKGHEIVHHINGIKHDNRIENLQLLDGTHYHLPYIFLEKKIKRLERIIREAGISLNDSISKINNTVEKKKWRPRVNTNNQDKVSSQ